jgi:primosomal protein N' (replication factor Y)
MVETFYYEVALINSPLTPLTYSSTQKIECYRYIDVPLGRKIVKAITLKEVDKPEFECKDISQVHKEYLTQKYIDIAKFISSYYVAPIGDSIGLFTPFCDQERISIPTVDDTIELSQNQTKAFEFVKSKSVSLLFGDTGSGKTEIYIKYFLEVINSGKSAIFLLPEISLTPQMKNRLKKVFGDMVATWHSKLTTKKKREILEGIHNGSIKIVAGARSALFLPLRDLSLIVVDEEHDDAYKAMTRPRYNARDVAIYFGKALGINVVLGSATPSLTSYHKFDTFRLRETFFDTQKGYLFQHSEVGLNDEILGVIKQNLQEKSQAIVFLPTRANYKYLVCNTCGKSVECPYCAVSMSLHKSDRAIKCHYCNYTERIPDVCPACKSGILTNKRIGTAEVTEILKRELPNNRIEKFDRDEIKSETKLKKVLKEFNNNKIDILVGTQMLSKGHDYHNVKLSVVLGIDSVLNMSDYRAREKAMSLLLQIAGRSGRKGDGKVLVQTLNKEFFKEYISDYEKFLKEELNYRVELYPPYVKLARVLFSDKSMQKASDNMSKALKKLEKLDNIEIVGASVAQIEKIANQYRYNILIRSNSIKSLLNSLYIVKDNSCEIDIDPTSFT